MTKKRIHSLYGIVLSASAILAGICLIVACVGIYRTGSSPFTRESVASAFTQISVPVYIFLALVIGGIGLDLFYPLEKGKLSVPKQYDTILANLQKKVDITKCDPELCKAILKQQNIRRVHRLITAGLLLICSIVFLSYGMNMQNFHKEDMNGSMIKAMYLFIPCLVIPFGYGVFTAYWGRRSMQREIELVKQAISAGSTAPAAQPAALKHNGKAGNIAKYAILAVSLVILVYGFIAGGTADVLAKAAAICTECVGLG